jgi:hypothetical protein
MKKAIYIIGLALIFLSLSLAGQQVIETDTLTITWDEVLPLGDDTISYDIYITSYPVADRTTGIILANVAVPPFVVTAPSEGDFAIGVRTVRHYIPTNSDVYSDINWSDIDGLATPDPFILRWIEKPMAPINLRIQ